MNRRRLNSRQPLSAFALLAIATLLATPSALAVISQSISLNEISTPAFILDQHETDADPTTLRNGLLTNATVSISRSFFDPAINANYRIVYSLTDSSGTTLDLSNGGINGSAFIAASLPFSVSLSGFSFSYTNNIELYPDPVNTLDNKELYFVRASLETLVGGAWFPVAGSSLDSNSTTVFHFTNTTSGDADWNILATVENLQWEKRHLLETDPTDNSFEASIDVVFARYDDWDLGETPVNTTLTLDFDLIESSSGNQIPLVDDGILSAPWNAPSFFDNGTAITPAFTAANATASLRPLAQLDSGSETYILRCTVQHIEDASATTATDAVCDADPVGLLHFNGNLHFGSIATMFDELSNFPSYGTTGTNFVNTSIRIPNGHGSLPLNPDLVFGNNLLLSTRLLDNGDAVVLVGSPNQSVFNPLAPAAPVSFTTNCLTFTYGPVILNFTGMSTNALHLDLPQGLIYLPNTTTSSHHGEDSFSHAATISLDGSANLLSPLTISLPPSAGIVDESQPLRIGVGDVTISPSGQLHYGSFTSIQYIHDTALDQLENDLALGRIEAVDSEGRSLDQRASNDHYWRNVNSVASTNLTVSAASDKSARISAEFDLAAHAFTTHFPQQVNIDWSTAGVVAIDSGTVVNSSRLVDVQKIAIGYHQTCPEDTCADGVPKADFEFTPDANELSLTPSGGLYRFGNLTASSDLRWGARGDGAGAVDPNYPYSHKTDQFTDGDFFMPGYQLYAAENPLLTTAPYTAAKGDNAPAALLLSGFNGDLASPGLHFATENPYILGEGHYPGLNFVVAAPGATGASRLGGDTSDYPYELADNVSKYYTRCAGVFGRHVGVDGTFNPTLNIYGYNFELNSFQLTFQASEQYESWINGAVAVSGHSSFTQKFLGLNLSCTGELEDATMDPSDNSDKNLVYWNSTFEAKSLSFSKELISTPGTCPMLYTGYLTMGISTQVAHIPTQLHGIFAFDAADGNLLTQTSGAAVGIDCELGLPARISMDSPADKDYTLVPTGKLRFSNPNQNPAAIIGNPGGWVSFGATINVPYFRDFQVQVMTSANDTPAAPLYLAPGWTSGGLTFFSSKEFDPDHVSWPKGAINIAEYQSPNASTDPTYLITAEQDLFGLVPLTYPMQWNDITRSFKSMTPNHEELIVLEMDHQVDYLDSDATKISFGAQYDGIPQLSLSNLLNSQIDQAAESVSDALTVPLKNALDSAFQEFEDFLADSLDAVIDPVVDNAADLVLCPLYDELKTHYDTARAAGDTWAQFKADLDAEIAARIYDSGFPTAATALRLQLEDLADVGAGAASMTNDLQNAIEQIILGIDVIINTVELDVDDIPVFNIDPTAVISGSSGLLKESVNGEREIIQNLVTLLLTNLVEPELEAILTPLLNNASSELNSELNALLEEIDPTLDQITQALAQVRKFLTEIHAVIESSSGFIADFNDLVALAITSVDGFQSIMDKPATRALSFLEDLAANHGINIATGTDQLNQYLDLFEDFDKETFVQSLKTELKDAIMQSDLMEQFQFLVRQTLYDFQLKFEQTVSTVLAQVTDVMKSLISETIGALEDEINPLIGKVNEVMGAGEINGYAEINGDSLRKLRIDAKMQLQIPDEMELNVYLEIISYTSEDETNGCVDAGELAVEVTIGATDVDLDWISDDLRASFAVKMSLKDEGSGLRPNGVGGSFELTGGEISIDPITITDLAATVAIGLDDCYLGARASGVFNSYAVSAGVFFGKTCTIEPLQLVDADVASVLNGPFPMIGAYAYCEVWLPISELVLGIPATCLFNISAGVGAGAGFFIDGGNSPIFVGKMFAGISGEALCVVSIKGEVTMVGVVQQGSFSASGTGKLSGKAGACPFCIKFSATAKVSYSNGDWDIDY